MKRCPGCALYFHDLGPKGRCEECEEKMNPGQNTQGQDNELQAMRSQIAQQQQQIQRLSGSNAGAQLNERFAADPAGTTHAIAAAVAQQTLHANFDTMVETARNAAAARPNMADVFAEHGDAIAAKVDLASQGQPALKTNVNVWANAATMVAGEHAVSQRRAAAEAAREASGRGQAPAVRIGDGPAPPSAAPLPSASGAQSTELTADELRVAKKLGISAQQYKDGKQAVAEMGTQFDEPDAASPFDAVMTFDGYTGKNRKAA